MHVLYFFIHSLTELFGTCYMQSTFLRCCREQNHKQFDAYPKKKMCNMEILKVVTSKMQMTKEDKKSRH